MKHTKLFLAASIMMLSIGMSAQPQGMPQDFPQGFPQGGRPMPQRQRTPEEIAKKEADRMKSEVSLTDKQYKKVYKLLKKDQQYRQNQAEKQFGEGMPPHGGGPGGMGGGPGGMGGGMMGGGPGGMGGGMMGGGPGGMGGGRPQGEMGQRPRPEGGHTGMGPLEDVVTEEYLEKQEQKLKKILTDDQYSKWRSKHPMEHLELPPL